MIICVFQKEKEAELRRLKPLLSIRKNIEIYEALLAPGSIEGPTVGVSPREIS